MRLHYRVALLASLLLVAGATKTLSKPPSATSVPIDATAPATTTSAPVESPTKSTLPIGVTPGGAATPGGTRQSSTRPGWSTYTDNRYRVAFDFPAEWDVPRQDYYGPRFEGGSGFVMLAATCTPGFAGGLLGACRLGAEHILHPYGRKPHIVSTTVAGRPACVIVPSADQHDKTHPAEADIDPPGPVLGNYLYLVVYADQRHLRAILATLHFLPAPGESR